MVLLIVTLVAVLSELGFNVTTLVAGTSVVAAAIAFGTQSIVKDLLSGVFLLVEDQLGVSQDVDMQLASGTVEEIGLRVTPPAGRRRDPPGTSATVRCSGWPTTARAAPTDRLRRCRTWPSGWWSPSRRLPTRKPGPTSATPPDDRYDLTRTTAG